MLLDPEKRCVLSIPNFHLNKPAFVAFIVWHVNKGKLSERSARRDDTDGSFDPDKALMSGFLKFLRALILYGYLIPISLYVSIEVVKFLQAMLINNDQHLFDDMSGKSVEARTSNLNEELGQVEMILTDKMGTLTWNQMEFRKCSIEGIFYGGDVNEIVRAASQRLNIDIESYRFNLDNAISTPGHSMEMVEMSSDQIKESRNILALCHTEIPVKDEQTSSHKLKYEAESPKEVTFLMVAQEFGFQFYKRTQSSMFVKEIDSSSVEVEREYKLLNLLEFSSSKTRMSVIVHAEAGQIFLFCKGADKLGDGGRTYQHATTMHLANYAEDGLRTKYEEWSSSFAKAKSIIGPEREEMLENVSETIEKELVLNNKWVNSECIDKLAQAGTKIWLLTGDKKETAVNIGFACSLLKHDMQQFHLSLSRDASYAVNLGEISARSRRDLGSRAFQAMKDDILNKIEASYRVTISEKTKDDPFALVVDGKSFEIALRNDLRDHFLQLAVNCASVICCRVSPKQKA
ncbi:probable phospholipid-transporting ATPase 4 [Tanacetum coccineum]